MPTGSDDAQIEDSESVLSRFLSESEESEPKTGGFGSVRQSSRYKNDGEMTLEEAVDVVLRKADLIPQTQLSDLFTIIEANLHEREGRPLTLLEELNQNKRIIRQIRAGMFTSDGSIKPGNSLRDVKEVLATMNSLETTIGKLEAQAFGQERLRTIERALTDCIRLMSDEAQEMFFKEMEKNLIILQGN